MGKKQKRVVLIYKEIFESPRTKQHFADLFGITTKSVENAMKKLSHDIIYDRKIGKYRFSTLIPSVIPLDVFFGILKDSIANQIIKRDILSLDKFLSGAHNESDYLVPTERFSPLVRNILISHVAIRHNCILKIVYDSLKKPTETKYIRPHKITSTGFVYYLYASYDKKNKENIGESRSFAFNAIKEIEAIEYVKDGEFSIDLDSNAYGIISKNKYVVLHLTSAAAMFFKREKQFERDEFEFLYEEAGDHVVARMYYNNIDEVTHVVQQWMPNISIDSSSPEKIRVYGTIKDYCKELIDDFQGK